MGQGHSPYHTPPLLLLHLPLRHPTGTALQLAHVMGCASSVTATLHPGYAAVVLDAVEAAFGEEGDDWLVVDSNWCIANRDKVASISAALKVGMPNASTVVKLLTSGHHAAEAVALTFVLLTVSRLGDVLQSMDREQAAVQAAGGPGQLLVDEAGDLVVPPLDDERRQWLKDPLRSGSVSAYEPIAPFCDGIEEGNVGSDTDCEKLFDTPGRKGGRVGKRVGTRTGEGRQEKGGKERS